MTYPRSIPAASRVRFSSRKGGPHGHPESIKKGFEQATGWARPTADEAARLLQGATPSTFLFADDGLVPNHPRWPLILYRDAVRLTEEYDPAAIFEVLFGANDWQGSWRNGIYPYVHYHSRTHEVLGVARGRGTVQLGGDRGQVFELKAGDVAILPAGTGHKCLSATEDFLVVGAYPPEGEYDEYTKPEEHDRAVANIAKAPRPQRDPVYGDAGALLTLWP